MAENVYLLKVSKDAEAAVEGRLGNTPTHVRLATLAPLSNYGYPPGAEGGLISVNGEGLVVGVEGNDEVPRSFVPWQNVSYLADGQKLAEG